ncbi:MAG: zinc-ribbon domain-containing protein [Oscillospiraceae bacterium]
MYCSKCGQQIADDAVFCQKCGTAVNDKAPSAASTPQVSNKKQITIPDEEKEKKMRLIKQYCVHNLIIVAFIISFLATKGFNFFFIDSAELAHTAFRSSMSYKDIVDVLWSSTGWIYYLVCLPVILEIAFETYRCIIEPYKNRSFNKQYTRFHASCLADAFIAIIIFFVIAVFGFPQLGDEFVWCKLEWYILFFIGCVLFVFVFSRLFMSRLYRLAAEAEFSNLKSNLLPPDTTKTIDNKAPDFMKNKVESALSKLTTMSDEDSQSDKWICKSCGTPNEKLSGQCKGCGKYK